MKVERRTRTWCDSSVNLEGNYQITNGVYIRSQNCLGTKCPRLYNQSTMRGKKNAMKLIN